MTNDQMVYSGILICCDTCTNLTLRDAVERRNEDGRVVEEKRDCMVLRGDSVCFVAPDATAESHRRSNPETDI